MTKKISGYDYGECEICNTPMQEKLIKQDFWIKGSLLLWRTYLPEHVHSVVRKL
ncbi:MAG: hypothetical protein MRK02_12450 [Candidatus Scalindua sp.]|nr:hypothetical protein [Candidatus Scalindua sp.]